MSYNPANINKTMAALKDAISKIEAALQILHQRISSHAYIIEKRGLHEPADDGTFESIDKMVERLVNEKTDKPNKLILN